MRKSAMLMCLVSMVAMLPPFSVVSARYINLQNTGIELIERSTGEVLCLPVARPQEPDHCLVAGAAQVLSQMEKQGITVPPAPFPFDALPSKLASIPFQYALASEQAIKLFGSLDAAMADKVQRVLPAGKKYIAYSERVEIYRGVFYRIQTGEWISSESVQSRVGYSTASRGVLVDGVPRVPFGWTIDIVETRNTPGLKGKLTGRSIPIYSLVWAYETVVVDKQDWVRVGLNEWAEKRLIGRVFNRPTPPEGVTNGRWIEINLYDQTLSVYEQNRMVFSALIASGINQMATRPGLFQISKKVAAENMTGSFEADRSDYYYLESVPWTMYFDGARALHGVYWRTSFGRQVSHGCVNMTVADSRWLFDWAKEGDWVFAWDERDQK